MTENDEVDPAAIARVFALAAAGAAGDWDVAAMVEAHVALGFEAEPMRLYFEALADATKRLDTTAETTDKVLELHRKAIASHRDPDVRWDLLRSAEFEEITRKKNRATRALKATRRRLGSEG